MSSVLYPMHSSHDDEPISRKRKGVPKMRGEQGGRQHDTSSGDDSDTNMSAADQTLQPSGWTRRAFERHDGTTDEVFCPEYVGEGAGYEDEY